MSKFLILLITLCSLQIKAQICFEPTITIADIGGTHSPENIKSADINNDGNMDLIFVKNDTAFNVTIQLGDGTGHFGPPSVFSVGEEPEDLTIADFNGDHFLDIATGQTGLSPYYVYLLLGDGTGNFSPATTFSIPNGTVGIISADFNSDGKMDVVSVGGTHANVLLGNGMGGFGSYTSYTVGIYPIQIITGYFNADTIVDLAVCNYGTNNVSVLIGNGMGGFTVNAGLTVGTGPYSIGTADFNRDGYADLITGNLGSGDYSVLLGNGAGGFAAAVTTGSGIGSSSLACGDYNNDGKTDIAFAGTNVILPGNGTGGFDSPIAFSAPNASDVVTADFNNDNKPDLATCNYFSSNASVLLSCTTTGIQDIAAADIITVYPNPSNGSFTIDMGNTSVKEIRVTDVLGKIVFEQIKNIQSKVNIDNLQNGLYLLTIIDNNNKINTKKMISNR